jgi:hypothetical protein
LLTDADTVASGLMTKEIEFVSWTKCGELLILNFTETPGDPAGVVVKPEIDAVNPVEESNETKDVLYVIDGVEITTEAATPVGSAAERDSVM